MLLLIQMSCQPETDSISPSQTVVTVKIAEDNQGSTVFSSGRYRACYSSRELIATA